MKVSAVVPVRNGELWLGSALESLAAQTRPPDEIVVVDDGSTDRSAEVARAAGVRVESLLPSGPAAARNLGARSASGDVLVFLDADDLALPNRIELQLEHLEPAGLVFGWIRNFSSDGPGRTLTAPMPSTLTVGRKLFLETGAFDEELAGGELFEWLDRCRSAGIAWQMVEKVVACRRVHGGNLTVAESTRQSMVAAVAKAIARRRSEASDR